MQISKIILATLFLFLVGCQEPKDVIPSVPVPSVIDNSYVQTSLGTVYLGKNQNIDLANFIKATPVPPSYTTTQNILPNKDMNLINVPTVKYGSGRLTSVVTKQDNGGQYAFSIPNIKQNGIYANHSVYPDLNLNTSPNQNLNVLYAPTTHAPNSCLEAGSNYWRGQGENSPTVHYVRLYDFCNNVGWNTGISLSINSNFISNYVRNFDNKTPKYTMEIIGSVKNGWSFQIFNYKNNIWDRYYTSVPGSATYNGGEGWSLFETHYTEGPCTKTPLIESTNIKVLIDDKWVNPVNNTNSWGNCFNNIGGNPTNFGNHDNNMWNVVSR